MMDAAGIVLPIVAFFASTVGIVYLFGVVGA